MQDREPLAPDELETLRLALGETQPPPAFAGRVVAMHLDRGRRRRFGRFALAAVAILAAAALLIAVARRGVDHGSGGAPRLTLRADHLSTQTIGRAVIVTEPGAELAWTPSRDGDAELVRQGAGAAFYRVEPGGGTFVVRTPLADVIVEGTCFRVEVDMQQRDKMFVAAAAGAVLAVGVTVTVYEGSVRVHNARGEVRATPGERVVVSGAGAPSQASGPELAAAGGSAPADPSGATASRDQLLGEVRSLREQVATLTRQRDAALTRASRAGRDADAPELLDLHPSDWKEMAQRCEVRYVLPPMKPDGAFGADRADELGLTPSEASAVAKAFRDAVTHHLAALRALYVEATGDSERVNDLNPSMLWVEILDKARDSAAARKRIAEEHAGLIAPPADPSASPLAERYFRLVYETSDHLEAALTTIVGQERARMLRMEISGDRGVMSGCDDD